MRAFVQRPRAYGSGRPAPAAGLPSWLVSAAVHEWVNVPNSTPSLAAGLVPAVAGDMGNQSNMVNAWDGAFSYGSKFDIHGGGHGDYGGNEIGEIDTLAESPAWELLVQRTPLTDILYGENYNADGRPASRHTYYGMWVVTKDGARKFVRFNAFMGFAYNGNPAQGPADVRTVDIDAFNLDSRTWEPSAYGPSSAINGSETSMAQDRATGDCYAWCAGNVIRKWTVATNVCAQVADLSGTDGNGGAITFDTINQRLVRIGGRSGTKCVHWTVGSGNTRVDQTVIGPDAADINGLAGNNHGWGIAQNGDGTAAYVLDNSSVLRRIRLADFYTERITPTGPALGAPPNGCWGRLQAIPEAGLIAYLESWSSPLRVMKVN